jgi:hypothetical protein
VAAAWAKPVEIALASRMLAGSDVACCAGCGSPRSKRITPDKGEETRQAMVQGATGNDGVVNSGGSASKRHVLAAGTLITALPVIVRNVVFQWQFVQRIIVGS